MDLLPSFLTYLFVLVFEMVQFVAVSSLVFCATEFTSEEWQSRRRLFRQALSRFELRRQFKSSFFNLFIHAFVMASVASQWMLQHGSMYYNVSDYGWPYFCFSFLILLVIHDAYFYWMHWVLHIPFFYKHFHSYHHRMIQPSPYGAYAFHPVETAFHGLWVLPATYFIPFNIYALVAYSFIYLFADVHGHLGFEVLPSRWRNKKMFKHVTMSLNHNAHHADGDENYGFYFMFWDKFMKTYSRQKTPFPPTFD